jgi:hypothetical protein
MLTLKYSLAVPLIFVGCLWCSMRLLRDVHKKEIRNESDVYFFAVIVQSAKGINVLWGREELDKFVAENKDAKFLIQPGEVAQIQNYCNERERAIGVTVGPILDAKQEIKLTVEMGPGLYSFAYEAAANGVRPLYTNRYTIVDGVAHFGIAALATGIILFVLKKARQKLLLTA